MHAGIKKKLVNSAWAINIYYTSFVLEKGKTVVRR